MSELTPEHRQVQYIGS